MPRGVFILDDEVMIADLTEEMVRELGYKVVATAHHRGTNGSLGLPFRLTVAAPTSFTYMRGM